MKTAIELLRVTPTRILQRAKASTIVSFAVNEESGQETGVQLAHAYVLAGVVCSPPTGSGRLHMVQLRLYSPFGKQSPTWGVCDCADEQFRWQTARTLKGSGSNVTSNGKLPKITNPGFVFAVCVAGDTLIETKRGLIPARQVTPADRLLSMYGHYHQITESRCVEKQTITLRTKKGYVLTCSLDHPVLTINEKLDLIWKLAGELHKGDHLCISSVPRKPARPKPTRRQKDIARICGYLTAEGYRFSFSNSSLILIRDFERICQRLGWTYRRDETPPQGITKEINYQVTITGKPTELIQMYGCNRFRTSESKIVPPRILQAHPDLQRAFLGAYWEGDGHISKGANLVTAASKSKKLAQDIQLLLLHLGIFTSRHAYWISSLAPGGRTFMFFVRASGLDAQEFARQIPAIRSWRKKRLQAIRQSESTLKRNLTLPGAQEYATNLLTTAPRLITPVGFVDTQEVHWSEIQDLFVAGAGETFPLQVLRHEARAGHGGKPERVFATDQLAKFMSGLALCPNCGKRIVAQDRPGQHITLCSGNDQGYDEHLGAIAKPYRVLQQRGINKSQLETFFEFAESVKTLQPELYVKAERIRHAHVLFDPVVAFNLGKKKQSLYDFGVANSEHFVANGLVVHNCKHLAKVITRCLADAKVRKIIFGLPLEDITSKRYPGRVERPKLTGRKH